MIPLSAVRACTYSARLDCHYLLHVPDSIDERTLLVAALHGFGSDAETMLRLAATMFGEEHALASVQGPNQFYKDLTTEEIGYGWITRRHAPSSIRLHHEMVLHVLHEAGREYGIPPERRILMGFSQPVSLNYRLAATHPQAVRGVVGVCGGLPSDWETGPYRPVDAAVLHIARRSDEVYPPKTTERFPERLKLRAPDVEFHLIEGGHRFPSKGRPLADGWMARIFGGPGAAP
jgi:predicted esterase